MTTPSGDQPKARVTYVAQYYDQIGRPTATANYGTYGANALTRPSTVADRSDDVLVSSIEYNDRGEAYKSIDPAGREDRREFDAAGRVIRTIQNYQDGVVDGDYPDEDVTVETTYNADGRIATLTAKNPTTGDQVTRYVYGTTLADSAVARADVLRAEIYPDSDDTADPLGDGDDELYDRVEFAYNRQGQPVTRKDQNGTVRQFDYDGLGRLVADKVTTVGAGVDDAVRRIDRAYEVRGMLEKLTSYDAASGGSPLNEVLLEYDSAGLLSKEHQEHGGTKDAETLYVQYNYDQSASGGVFTKGLRPTSLRYPNGRQVHTTYGTTGSAADALARVAAINGDNSGSPGDALAEYQYLGLGTIVTEDYPEPDVKLDYIGDGSYSGFDRFGRVVDHKWYDYGASAVRDQYTYGYDRASNRLYRENVTASGKDELYGYDAINRLVAFDRGDLNGEKTAISGTPVREEDWTLDPLGNWPGYVQKTSGTTNLDQERTHNKVNEITAITATTGTDWADPVHDRAGNMTTIPKPSSLADGLTCTYDAWNRLVEVQDGETTIGRYEYDGLNRRIKKHLDSQAPDDPHGIDKYVHYFYNRDWQVLETRETTSESAEPEDLQPKHQYIWSLRYIDAPILRDENTDQDSLCDDQRLYYLNDANFNITTLTDTNGDGLERYLYAPYGTVTIYDPSWSSTRSSSLYTNLYSYTGRELDPESGLYHYRNRYYSAKPGAFVSRDPIGFSGNDVKLYRYVSNRAVWSRDPLGLVDTDNVLIFPIEIAWYKMVTWMGSIIFFHVLPSAFAGPIISGVASNEGVDTYKTKGAPNQSLGATWVVLGVTPSVRCDPATYKWHPQFIIEGYILALVAPPEDPRWETWSAPSAPADASKQQKIIGTINHESDHYNTHLVGYNLIVANLGSIEAMGFSTGAAALSEAQVAATQAIVVWLHAIEHSEDFDQPPWNTGNQYPNHPFPYGFYDD